MRDEELLVGGQAPAPFPGELTTRRMIQRVIGTINPASSAMRRNRSGASTPSTGWRQRSSASAPTILQVRKSMIG